MLDHAQVVLAALPGHVELELWEGYTLPPTSFSAKASVDIEGSHLDKMIRGVAGLCGLRHLALCKSALSLTAWRAFALSPVVPLLRSLVLRQVGLGGEPLALLALALSRPRSIRPLTTPDTTSYARSSSSSVYPSERTRVSSISGLYMLDVSYNALGRPDMQHLGLILDEHRATLEVLGLRAVNLTYPLLHELLLSSRGLPDALSALDLAHNRLWQANLTSLDTSAGKVTPKQARTTLLGLAQGLGRIPQLTYLCLDGAAVTLDEFAQLAEALTPPGGANLLHLSLAIELVDSRFPHPKSILERFLISPPQHLQALDLSGIALGNAELRTLIGLLTAPRTTHQPFSTSALASTLGEFAVPSSDDTPPSVPRSPPAGSQCPLAHLTSLTLGRCSLDCDSLWVLVTNLFKALPALEHLDLSGNPGLDSTVAQALMAALQDPSGPVRHLVQVELIGTNFAPDVLLRVLWALLRIASLRSVRLATHSTMDDRADSDQVGASSLPPGRSVSPPSGTPAGRDSDSETGSRDCGPTLERLEVLELGVPVWTGPWLHCMGSNLFGAKPTAEGEGGDGAKPFKALHTLRLAGRLGASQLPALVVLAIKHSEKLQVVDLHHFLIGTDRGFELLAGVLAQAQSSVVIELSLPSFNLQPKRSGTLGKATPRLPSLFGVKPDSRTSGSTTESSNGTSPSPTPHTPEFFIQKMAEVTAGTLDRSARSRGAIETPQGPKSPRDGPSPVSPPSSSIVRVLPDLPVDTGERRMGKPAYQLPFGSARGLSRRSLQPEVASQTKSSMSMHALHSQPGTPFAPFQPTSVAPPTDPILGRLDLRQRPQTAHATKRVVPHPSKTRPETQQQQPQQQRSPKSGQRLERHTMYGRTGSGQLKAAVEVGTAPRSVSPTGQAPLSTSLESELSFLSEIQLHQLIRAQRPAPVTLLMELCGNRFPALRALTLSDLRFGDKEASAFCELMGHCTYLQVLHMPHCMFLSLSAKAHFGKAFATLRTLVDLNLEACDLGTAGAQELVVHWLHPRALHHLNLRGNRLGLVDLVRLAGILQKMPALRTLDLGTNRSRVASRPSTRVWALLPVLAQSLGMLHHLQSLSLAGVGISSSTASCRSWIAVFRNLSHLRILDLSRMSISTETFAAITLGLVTIGPLTELDLSGNKLDADAPSYLVDCLRSLTHLKVVKLQGNPLTASGIKELQGLIETYRLALDYLGLPSSSGGDPRARRRS